MNNGGSFHRSWYVYHRVNFLEDPYHFAGGLAKTMTRWGFRGSGLCGRHFRRGGISPDYMVEHPILIGGDWNMVISDG